MVECERIYWDRPSLIRAILARISHPNKLPVGAQRTGAYNSPVPSLLLALIHKVPGETVWKIGKASSSTSPEGGKGVEKPYFAPLCHRTNMIENPFGYFPNSF